MNKRTRDGSAEMQENHVLGLAELGKFESILELLDILVLKDAVVRRVMHVCDARIDKVCAEFELAQAVFIAKMNAM